MCSLIYFLAQHASPVACGAYAIIIYYSLCYAHVVRLSVTLVDCDHIVQQKVEIGHDSIGRCLAICKPKSTQIVVTGKT